MAFLEPVRNSSVSSVLPDIVEKQNALLSMNVAQVSKDITNKMLHEIMIEYPSMQAIVKCTYST